MPQVCVHHLTRGKVRVEDAGFDWKILGSDVGDVEYVAWHCDQDAYAASGQKCSAQSILFAHRNWISAGLLEKLAEIARERNPEDGTVGPVLSHRTSEMLAHTEMLESLPGARLLFGGSTIPGWSENVPEGYGLIQPTAVFVPLREIAKPENFDHAIKWRLTVLELGGVLPSDFSLGHSSDTFEKA